MAKLVTFLWLFLCFISCNKKPISVVNFDELIHYKVDSSTANKKELTAILSVNENKEFFIDKEPVNPQDLEAHLLAKLGEDKTQTVVVRIPYNLQVQDLVNVLQIGVKNNLKFVIATNKN
ncbi:ExbD/TolR family protein [Paenimyroides aestuarii]|uniref:Biopolymer transporter ExbD n=1 Tax=Paenimyroides aestuarii TaxID=2968490 RepID=A0ABY5NPZ6_9FLAO|nr:biopolymer transporter ExbD [Paenimyroides aestuarii]UUV20567.1 biopolymer transporter ExbD [Paenimyroides aestuarii]